MIRSWMLRCLPSHWRNAAGTYRILAKQGHLRSAKEQSCVDASGNPIPWYTYPSLEYLRQLDWRDKKVFEYGSGNSTLFWASRAKAVTSVESDLAWHTRIASHMPPHCRLSLVTDSAAYVRAITEPADVIVIDGDQRFSTAVYSRPFLRPGGLMILDNSDWHPKTAAFLRDSDLIEVDFTGCGPINGYAWTTSLFFSRDFNGKPARDRQPWPGVGLCFIWKNSEL